MTNLELVADKINNKEVIYKLKHNMGNLLLFTS